MKKMSFLVLLCLFWIVSTINAGEKIKIGFIVSQAEEPWFQLEWVFAEQAAQKYGFELIKIACPDGEKTLSAIDNLAANGAAGFVICPPEVNLGPAVMHKAKQHKLKVVNVDDQFVKNDGTPMTDVPYVGISAYAIGKEVGQTLWDQMKARGWDINEVGVCAVTFDELETIRERTDGAIDRLIELGMPVQQIYKAPIARVIEIPTAFDTTNILLTKHSNVKKWLICGGNDYSVLGAIRAMEGRKFGIEDVIGVGINGTDCIPEFEKSNPTALYGTMLLSAREHGYKTAELLYKWIANNEVPPMDTRTLGRLMTRASYKEILKEEGIE